MAQTHDGVPSEGPTEADFVDSARDRAEMAEAIRELRKTEARRAREADAEPSLAEFSVAWDDITQDQVDEFRDTLEAARDEPTMQAFLEANPHILVQVLRGGQGRWVIPEKKFDLTYKADFMIAEKSSLGIEWTAVELEGPQRKMFNDGQKGSKKGEPNQWLNHGIRQINDWRDYIAEERDHVRKPRSRHGLGLVNITSEVPGLLIIGRRRETPEYTNDRRARMVRQNRIEIHSWDWLLEIAQMRSDALEGKRLREAGESG